MLYALGQCVSQVVSYILTNKHGFNGNKMTHVEPNSALRLQERGQWTHFTSSETTQTYGFIMRIPRNSRGLPDRYIVGT